ncbi:DNA-deoxyinosine glycosylase [Nitrosomonas supralitoralis]|uniref:DNA-deoxyinosine glycosylase n=1 Tax=Nitrosomonas supralitoralis TaxID=2116706 RepID=A0A2P7NSN2_9PROT|nr:DNA-deoxyinosine glycosylase [Nitrosomonas supralitoralis]PSJ16455.1 DNA-deoxyinosine glycosylase [Nitrosomonas supralitoralis]
MPTIHSFAPIAGIHAKILILGSMPGEASLAENQYYAHPRNVFWPIMAPLLQIQVNTSYEEKIIALKSSPIALWDVLKSCSRTGSLDSMIDTETQIINNFAAFFSLHREITHVFFNGGKAETCFRRNVILDKDSGAITLSRLPSTSPANARLSFDARYRIWHQMIKLALEAHAPAAG